MKKIFLGLLLSAAMFTSCDMDTTHYGVISQDNYIETVDDAHSFINGMYISLRSTTGGSYIVWPDVQMDYFVGLQDNGNRLGPWSTGQILASDTDLPNLYYALYNIINDANYFLPRVEALMESEAFADDKDELAYYAGTAHFMRGYAYWYLFDKFVNYDTSALNTEGKGLQIVTEYNPSANRSSYVGRSSIKTTVDYINDELTAAYDLIKEYETNVSAQYCNPNAARVSSYVVEALQARMALLTQDYATALNKAEDVINSGKYVLCSASDYAAMWTTDESSELLFVPYAVQGQGGIGTGVNYLTNNQKNASDYIPTAEWLLCYDENDVRFDAFFEYYPALKVSGIDYEAFAFNKYPGNSALNTTTSNALLNKGKPFRLSELYLIAAEAAATDGAAKNETKANKYLNELRKQRITGYQDLTYTGNALLEAVKAERGKELIGEGFRLSDLRRWGRGMTRTAGFATLGYPLDEIENAVTTTTNNLTYQAGDYRFVWPIPYREMQVNPQLTGQQNPQY